MTKCWITKNTLIWYSDWVNLFLKPPFTKRYIDIRVLILCCIAACLSARVSIRLKPPFIVPTPRRAESNFSNIQQPTTKVLNKFPVTPEKWTWAFFTSWRLTYSFSFISLFWMGALMQICVYTFCRDFLVTHCPSLWLACLACDQGSRWAVIRAQGWQSKVNRRKLPSILKWE